MFYYNYVSLDWFPLYLGMAVLATIAHLVMCFCSHESPQWLLCQGRREEAIASLNFISRVNGYKNLIPNDALIELNEEPKNYTVDQTLKDSIKDYTMIDQKGVSHLKLVGKLSVIGMTSVGAYWILLYLPASLPGRKFHAGYVTGFGEFVAQLFTGFICKYFRDTKVFMVGVVITLLSQFVFYYGFDGNLKSTSALVCFFVSIMGIGIQYCTIFILTERRVSAEKLGSAISIVLSVCVASGAVTN
jgi:hypothetical protein